MNSSGIWNNPCNSTLFFDNPALYAALIADCFKPTAGNPNLAPFANASLNPSSVLFSGIGVNQFNPSIISAQGSLISLVVLAFFVCISNNCCFAFSENLLINKGESPIIVICIDLTTTFFNSIFSSFLTVLIISLSFFILNKYINYATCFPHSAVVNSTLHNKTEQRLTPRRLHYITILS